MKNIDGEINQLQKIIDYQKKLINDLDKTQLDLSHKELLQLMKEELLKLELERQAKLEIKKTGIYIPKKPELGDERYKNFLHKKGLDILRILYYDFFQKDPSLSLTENNWMFGDSTLPIPVTTFLIKGEIPFKLMLTSVYADYQPNDKYSIGIKFEKNHLTKEIGPKYLELMSMLIKRYSNNDINFICCDGLDRNCTLAYIGNNDFSFSNDNNEYYDFFELLCDNLWRNIVYIGNTMKQNTKPEDIKRVDSKFVIPHIKFIAKGLGIPTQTLMESNEQLRRQVLTLIKK